MRDWRSSLREAIDSAGFDPARREEVLEELTAHVEEEYERELHDGRNEEEAEAAAEASLGDRELLGRRLRCIADNQAGDLRARHLWLPGFYCGVVSASLLSAVLRIGPGLRAFWLPDPDQQNLVFCFEWLAMLPAVGAMTSIYAARSGAATAQRILAAVSPAVIVGILLLLLFLPKLLLFPRDAVRLVPMFFASLLSWVIVPGAALAAGALPTLRRWRSSDFTA